MKGWTKRRIALILALALIAAQMTGCKKKEADAQNAIANENAVIVETTEVPAQEEMESADAVAWLEENLENIHQSLLSGEYAQVVDLLLGMQDQLRDNAEYNALLYIAYMGNGNESDAAALLKNPNLDTNDFTDAFLENADSLKDNADIAAIERALMEHMLALGETNPQAYESVARIGVNIYNSNPSDPTAYAARYLAALAAGDEEAAKAILAEAEANGVSAESLQTTAIAFIEEYNLTAVSVEEIQKGKNTSTTYNSSGDVVKSEVTVDNNDGTETKYIYNSDGTVVAEAIYDKASGKLLKRTDYTVERNTDPVTGEVSEVLTGEKEVYTFENGVLKSLTLLDNSDCEIACLSITPDGVAESGYEYVNGKKVAYSDGILSAYSFVLNDGNLMARSKPVVDETGNVVGKKEAIYAYANPIGLPIGTAEYTGNAVDGFEKTKEISVTWEFDGNVKGNMTNYVSAYYVNGMKEQEYALDYDENQELEKSKIITYDPNTGKIVCEYIGEYDGGAEFLLKESKTDYAPDGTVMDLLVNDYINHTRQYYSDGQYYDITLDESNTYVLVQTIYNGENTEGQLYAKNFRRYDGVTQFSEVQVIYDENGNVIFETYFDHVGEDGAVDKTAASKIVMYTYDENNNVKKYTETYYDVNGDITTQSRAEYTYDEDNDVIERLESGVDAFGEYTFYFKDIYDEDKNLIRTEQYNEFMGNRYLALVSESEYDEEGRKIYNKISFSELYGGQTCSETYYTYESGSVTVTTKDYNSGTVSTVRTDQIKDDNGNVISETVYNVGPGADGTEVATEVSKTEYTYDEQGNSTGYSVSTPNAEGGFDVTYYTAEGYPYQKAIYDTSGQLLMVMRLDENAPDEVEEVEDETVTDPTEGEDTVTDPTEGEDTVTDLTEGEDTVTGSATE